MRKLSILKNIVLVAALMFWLCTGCAGIDRLNTKHKTDSQLKLRLTQIERELSGVRWGADVPHDISMLETERDAIERELLQRYEHGDSNARLQNFR